MQDTPAPAELSTPAPSGELPEFSPGQRVHSVGDSRRTGTVRYVGPLEGHPGTWIGVDWDDARGKHDGSVNSVRYFSAHGPTSATFCRPKNLSRGISFLEALRIRYLGEPSKEEEAEMYVLSTSNKRVCVELVGMDKVQEKLKCFEDLVTADVAYMGIAFSDDPHEISALIPNLRHVQLTGNLLSKWQEVCIICQALPALEILNLSNNRLEKILCEIPVLNSIHTLVINNCGITWKEVDILKKSLPAIEELHLMKNASNTISTSGPSSKYVEGFNSLKVLNLEDNNFECWDEIVKLSKLRSLKQLQLNTNNLKMIYYPHDPNSESPMQNDFQDKEARPFQNLHCLLLGNNNIEDLDSVDSLNYFPNLVDIRLSDNPVADPARGGIPRFIHIARLAKVVILNGSEVSPRERKESEVRYVRLAMTKLNCFPSFDVNKQYPRFNELKLLHGIDDERPTGVSGPQNMAIGLLDITLKCLGATIGENNKLTKRLPPTTTIGRLKVLCQNFYNLKSIKIRLFFQEMTDSPFPRLLEDEMSTLEDFGIGSGATILIDVEP